ncbi:UDP-N-acetylmuramoyl-L-alanyl-D-glutamate synthetase [Parvularcula bermudensis HTCC2503]|uniref:UDP-N-acetylmuramoyl-L-alanyl-D-glutamate synthetase n=1 Tax=Parvularcula bermudensis (strain ATCC BAA-594 / HTCC2503 / KCTC 12087) TaxID=314260 RepID=E0TDS9_PARBH|nr:UDP-N-acetylmuramoyl-L-alanyl-D-glutamate synthetase [Parvularcula bermudensis]ADM09995.1 UDP-N-acetylmuramoyl-L-alanyl-D-glutamate synthetase [Parvularcula bermudensis HTCC2503]
MIPLPLFDQRIVGVLGLGPSGLAVVEALTAGGARVIAWDAEEAARASCGADILAVEDWPIAEMAAIILADGDRDGLSRQVVVAAGEGETEVLTDLDLFALGLEKSGHRDDVNVIAVTGAAGKSVTISIIAHILREQGRAVAIGGDLGAPFLGLPAPNEGMTYLLELPVRRLTTVRRMRTDVSIVLNVAGRRPTAEIELALRSLLKIYRSQNAGDTAIVGVDDPIGQKVCTLLRSGRADVATIGTVIPVSGEASLGHGVFVLDGAAYSAKRGRTQTLGDFSRADGFLGTHFNQDAAAATAACLSMGIAPAMIVKSLHSYSGLPGRFECLGAAGKVIFVDDSYASCQTAAERAVNACPNVFWIGGGPVSEGGEVPIAASAINGAYFLGDGKSSGETLPSAFEAAFLDARAFADKDPDAAPVVLFSPGVPAAQGGFAPDEFRSLAAQVIDTRY